MAPMIMMIQCWPRQRLIDIARREQLDAINLEDKTPQNTFLELLSILLW